MNDATRMTLLIAIAAALEEHFEHGGQSDVHAKLLHLENMLPAERPTTDLPGWGSFWVATHEQAKPGRTFQLRTTLRPSVTQRSTQSQKTDTPVIIVDVISTFMGARYHIEGIAAESDLEGTDATEAFKERMIEALDNALGSQIRPHP